MLTQDKIVKKQFKNLERACLLPIPYVFKIFDKGRNRKHMKQRFFNLNGIRVSFISCVKPDKIATFKQKELVCNHCGIQAFLFAVERNIKQSSWYNFNLYGIDASGDEVLMTKDHIIPLAKGGSNTLDNIQILCYPCNIRKGDKLDS